MVKIYPPKTCEATSLNSQKQTLLKSWRQKMFSTKAQFSPEGEKSKTESEKWSGNVRGETYLPGLALHMAHGPG